MVCFHYLKNLDVSPFALVCPQGEHSFSKIDGVFTGKFFKSDFCLLIWYKAFYSIRVDA